MAEAAQLVGGPSDGKVMATPERWPYINVAIAPEFSWEDPPGVMLESRIGVYRLEVGPLGKPSLNDRGEWIYTWQGER